jgi:hypothetical protein
MKVLLACTTYDGKSYCTERYLTAVSRLNYKTDKLVVDTSDGADFFQRWHDQIPMVRIDVKGETPDRKIALGMEHIRKYFLAGDWDFWLCLEQDIIAPPHTLDLMLSYSRGVDFLAAPYKHRTEDRMIEMCFGCSLFSRRAAEISFADAPSDSHTDVFWVQKLTGLRATGLAPHLLKLVHLNE